MATKYGGWVSGDDYRVVMDYSVSNNSDGTTCAVSVTTKIQVTYYLSNYNVSWSATANGTSSGTKTISVSGGTATLGSRSVTVNRGQTAGSLTVSASCNAYGSSSASATVSIPALASYAITYNANGGSGAPAAQTKYHGTPITLQTGTPTRTNYEFLGWSTNSSATAADSAYTKAKMTAGVSYTTNAALTLYAVWKLAFVAPTISKLTAFRSDSSGDSNPSSTSHIHVDVTWSVNTTTDTGNLGQSLAITIREGTTSKGTASATLSAASGTNSFTIAPSSGTFESGKSYIVSAVLTDKHLNVTKTVAVSGVVIPFTMSNQGLSAAFFGIARSTYKHILQIFGGSANDPAIRFHSARGNVQGGAAVPSSSFALASELVYDAADYNVYYSQMMHNTSDQIYHSYVVERKNSSGTGYQHGFYLWLNADGTPQLSFTSNNTGNSGGNYAVKYAWHKAISEWRQLATAKSGTAMSFTLPTDCTEVMVAAVCTTATNNVRVYAGSVVIPRVLLNTTTTEWLLGGGSANGGSSTSGIRYCAVDITTTSAKGVGAYSDGTDRASTTTFYVYAR